jgi:hypothetical protein
MGFISDLLGGVAGFLTGGPIGAAVGLFGSHEAGRQADKAQAAMQRAAVQVGPTGNTRANTRLAKIRENAYMQGLIEQLARTPAPDGFSVEQALQQPQTDRGKQFSARVGGMSTPTPAGVNGMGIYETERERREAGPGRGAGAPAGEDPWATYNQALQYRQNYTSPFRQQMEQFMQAALSGQGGLPEGAYHQALTEGSQLVNRQSQQSATNLHEALGARGLLQSGIMGRGLVDLERERLGGLQRLESGLQEQRLAASRESQRTAAGLFPQLLAADEDAAARALQGYLSLRQLELQGRQLGLSAQQINDQHQADQWALIGNLLGAYAQYRNRPQGSGSNLVGGWGSSPQWGNIA